MSKIPISLERLYQNHPLLQQKVRGLPNLGQNLNGIEFSYEVKKYMIFFRCMGMNYIN